MDRLSLIGVPLAEESPEEWAFRHGRSYDSYLATEADRSYFWSHDRQGMVAFVRANRHLYTSGGLLASVEGKRALLGEIVCYARNTAASLAFFNAHEDELPLFRGADFQVTKWGEEAIVDLTDRPWRTRTYQWVRRQVNYCRRSRVVVQECHWQLMTSAAWQETVAALRAVSSGYLSTKPQRGEIRFFASQFMPEQLGRRRLFIARAQGGRGRIEGFLVCQPCLNGRRWSFETYRHRPDAVRGVSAYLMCEAMIQFEQEGVESVSLGLVPGLRCADGMPGDSRLARWGLVLGTKYFGMILDVAGMYHFKSRFRPRFENRYLCVQPRVTWSWSWTLVRMLGVMRLDPRVIARHLFARFKKRVARRTLISVNDERQAA